MTALTMSEQQPPPPPALPSQTKSSHATAVEIVSLALDLLQDDDDENDLRAVHPKQSFDFLDSSSSSFSSKLPPLDQVTTCSDDSSSVSSLSSAEDDSFSAVLPPPPPLSLSSSSPPRSIFKTYWDKTGASPPLVIKRLYRSRPTTAVAPPVSRVIFTDNKDMLQISNNNNSSSNATIVPEEDLTEEDDNDNEDQVLDCGSEHGSVNTYERTLKRTNNLVSASPAPAPAAPSPCRRSIFGQQQLLQSQPNLSALSSFSATTFRKTQSTSALVATTTLPSCTSPFPPRSCLRQGRFSSSSGRSSSWCGSASHYSHSSFTSNVSFQEDVRVVVYQRPVEHWAADGWSQRFA